MKSFTQTLAEMDELAGFLKEDIENIQRVVSFCKQNDVDVEFEVHAKAETCDESVEHSPVELDQIVKTLVFMADEPIAVLAPGDRRVDEDKLEAAVGEEVRMANPSEVTDATGYIIGGVSPFDLDIPVYMDESIMSHEMVRPAAGSRAVGANIDPEVLKDLNDAVVARIS